MNDNFIKPTAEQTAWVFEKLVEAYESPCSYRKLIYDRMEYKPEDYGTLMSGILINNLLVDTSDRQNLISLINEVLDFLYKKTSSEEDLKIYRDFAIRFEKLLDGD